MGFHVEIDEAKCQGCGNCVPACATCMIEVADGKAKVDEPDRCSGGG